MMKQRGLSPETIKDRKFYIEDNDGKKLLLHVSDFKNYESKKKEFESMGKVYELGINMSDQLILAYAAMENVSIFFYPGLKVSHQMK